MKLTKKYFKVNCKLAWRTFKKSPSTYAIAIMSLIVISGLVTALYHTFKYSNILHQSTFTRWESQQKKFIGRTMASKAETCLTEFNPLHLLTEIKKLEADHETGHLIKGTWHGINLEKLPAIQAQLLTEFGHLIGDQKKAIDYTACSDVVCIFNKVYRDQDPTIGYLVYYWYLKTGSMISLSNLLPHQKSNYPGQYNGQHYELSQYLFNKEELQNFFILAKSLPETFLNIPLVKSFHRVPENAPLDPSLNINSCSHALANGAIMLKGDCLVEDKFFISATHEIARFLDLHIGDLKSHKSISSLKEWSDFSLWLREDYWQPNKKVYNYKWFSHFPKGQEVSDLAKQSPSSQLAEMLAHYRFDHQEFEIKTPAEIVSYLARTFFNNESYDSKGLLGQYLNSSIKHWDKTENEVWKKCFNHHFGPKNKFEFKNLRDVASTIQNPLYSCVEREAEDFIDIAIEELKVNEVKACDFFNNQNLSFYANQYIQNLGKYIEEKIVQRKIELKEFGDQVIHAQVVKELFKDSFDPKTVYIQCFNDKDPKRCYEVALHNLAKSAVAGNKKIQGHYAKLLIEELAYMHKYEDVVKQTNYILKRFLNPFNYKIEQTAGLLLEECKEKATNKDEMIRLPMIYTGGKHFVKSSLLNCVNRKFPEMLNQIVDAGAFQIINDEKVTYNLGYQERKLALDFLRQRFKNSIASLVDEQVRQENNYIVTHFENNQKVAIEKLKTVKSLFEDVYTMDHVQEKCIETIAEYYPDKFFYSSEKMIHDKHGRKICSIFVEDPHVNRLVNNSINKNWQDNIKLVEQLFKEEFQDEIEDCKDEFPLQGDRSYVRNSRMLRICIEDSYSIALAYALKEWRSEESYKYFANRENELVSHYKNNRSKILEEAWK